MFSLSLSLLCPCVHFQVMECSAKSNQNIKEIFLTFNQLARIPMPSDEGLKRRSSAQARVNAKNKFAGTNTLSPSHATTDSLPNASGGAVSPNSSPRLKPRSRSLIRRTSKKFSKAKEHSEVDDCAVS